ncbi:hypothetical protein BB559_000179 [Furculomyces boomerangus]|uniref:NADAR domain-containing protein n=1 Tax=Furculomyces boomerangus TaxID=61424 RepID=A0A2T9Z653_9FUNG|nr:hypothetical protein BB559_000179 [Furculomyces boomerangus]
MSNNKVFSSSEQLFMFVKAKHFGDEETAMKILQSGGAPLVAKKLGRQVKPFDDSEWNKVRYPLMCLVLHAKFDSDPKLRAVLLETEGNFVEASPRDRVWGIGMGAKNVNATNPEAWRGGNLMGKALDLVRKVISENKPKSLLASTNLIEKFEFYFN